MFDFDDETSAAGFSKTEQSAFERGITIGKKMEAAKLAAERAVSDRLLTQLRKIVDADNAALAELEGMQIMPDDKMVLLTEESAALITEVEAMRKENKE